jgi:TonB family protein
MRHYLIKSCLLVVCIAGCFWSGYARNRIVAIEQASKPEVWKEFTSTEGGFSIQLPGVPGATVTELRTPSGKLTQHIFATALKDSSYHISYIDYPAGADDPALVNQRLDQARETMLAKSKGMKMLSQRELALGSFPGREILILQNESVFGVFQIYLVRNRLYEIALLAPLEAAFNKGSVSLRTQDRTEHFNGIADRFFESLDITAATETMGEVERKLHELRKQERYQGARVLSPCSPCDAQESTAEPVLNGRALHLVTPRYPALARSAHASGTVRVQVLIDLDGTVAAAEIVDGHPLLASAALKAARESQFTPTQFEGKTVMVSGVIIYNFVAQ